MSLVRDALDRSTPLADRVKIVRSIGRLRLLGALEALISLSTDVDEAMEVRLAAIYGLCVLGNERAFSTVKGLLSNPVAAIRIEALKRINLLGEARESA
jgi:HEAT repeat protein